MSVHVSHQSNLSSNFITPFNCQMFSDDHLDIELCDNDDILLKDTDITVIEWKLLQKAFYICCRYQLNVQQSCFYMFQKLHWRKKNLLPPNFNI